MNIALKPDAIDNIENRIHKIMPLKYIPFKIKVAAKASAIIKNIDRRMSVFSIFVQKL